MVTRQLERVVPREIDSEVKFSKFLSMTDLMVVAGLFMLFSKLQSQVHPSISAVYLLYVLLVGVFLILPAGKNYPGKKVYHLLIFVIQKKRHTYWSANQYIEEREEDKSEI